MSRPRLAYTFGNHMHWVDMQWLWGYHVLPGSIRDMRKLVREAGVKGGVNFDAIGYEKLAAEDPEALAELKEAIATGDIEVIGGSYGQPYGQFHGGDSNVRQLIYGARTCRRLLGVWPKTFWEEEFYCFPQLPQMLVGAGYTGASLFFQWTWHTPEVPREASPVIWWQAPDGSKLKTATRNALNLHQWPEDMEILLNDLAANPPSQESGVPLIQQWLELMPSPDWMCRAEVILPRLRELLNDPRFEVVPTTLASYLETSEPTVTRQYDPGEMWHGLSLGKNSDETRRQSRIIETVLTRVEALAAAMSLFGRPYGQWDVYPTWELEEAWRELLSAQHHDNCECEGLCGHVGYTSYGRAYKLAVDASMSLHRCMRRRLTADVTTVDFGWEPSAGFNPQRVRRKDGVAVFETEFIYAEIDLKSGAFRRLSKPGEQNDGSKSDDLKIELAMVIDGTEISTRDQLPTSVQVTAGQVVISYAMGDPGWVKVFVELTEDGRALKVYIDAYNTKRPDPGYRGALRARFVTKSEVAHLYADSPYLVDRVGGFGKGHRKYPTGDWMTSPQWFEDIDGAFTGLTFVDLRFEDESGILVAQDRPQQWFKTSDGVEAVVGLYDPWDEDHYIGPRRSIWLMPHEGLSKTDCWTISRHIQGVSDEVSPTASEGDLPSKFAPLRLDSDHVRLTAFYREIGDYAGRHTEHYAGEGIEYPFIVRLVELEGKAGEVDLIVAGPVAKAFKTNLLGQIEQELTPEAADPNALYATPEELTPFGIVPQRLRFNMRANEIATLYLDLIPGRKQTRDLDVKREIWATVHRVE